MNVQTTATDLDRTTSATFAESATSPANKKVTISMTPQDIANVGKVQSTFQNRSKASAVSSALSLAALVTEAIQDGGEVVIKGRDGESRRIVVLGIS
jgi:hypothetical protein